MITGREVIRVAAVIDTASVSGPGRQLAELAVQLRANGVELRVITFHREREGAERARSPYLDYLDQAQVAYTVLPDRSPLDVRLIDRLQSALTAWQAHIVQTHGYKPTTLAYVLRSAGARWPWVAFSHGATAENRKVELYNWIERRLIGGADRVVVMSAAQKERLARLGDKVRVLHNAAIPLPADPPGSGPSGLPPAVSGGQRRPLLGVVGRLSPEKGIDVFLRACAELARRRLAFSAVIVGDGPERPALERLRDALGLTEHVRFVGSVRAIHAMYASLDLLVIPSRSEGLPNVLLEALRADLPVVATRVGAIPEVLDCTDAGVLVPPDAPLAIADAVVRGLALKNDSESRQARRLLTEMFSPERRTSAHLDLYRELLAARPPERVA